MLIDTKKLSVPFRGQNLIAADHCMVCEAQAVPLTWQAGRQAGRQAVTLCTQPQCVCSTYLPTTDKSSQTLP
jgi:hypothetical protein